MKEKEIQPNINHPHLINLELVSESQHEKVGGKNKNLSIMLRSGLPVPPGYAVTTEEYQHYLETGSLSTGLVEAISHIKYQYGGQIAIRSSANLEDSEELSMAGVFESIYLDQASQADEITAAIEAIYNQSLSVEVVQFLSLHNLKSGDLQMSLVVEKLITPDISGVIYTDMDDKLFVQYTDGFGNKLVDGEVSGSSILISTNTGVITSSLNFERNPLSDNQIRQLITLSENTTSILGPSQDIEFAMLGGEIFILQSRPMTTSIDRLVLKETPLDTLETERQKIERLITTEKQRFNLPYAVFEAGNFHELLPQPTEMDFGIFAYIFTGVDGLPGGIQLGRTKIGYPLAMQSLGFNYYIAGKPYVSEAAAISNYYIGFPYPSDQYYPTLGVEYITKLHDNSNASGYGNMDVYLQNPTLEDLQMRFPTQADEYFQIANAFNQNMAQLANTYRETYLADNLPKAENFIASMETVDLTLLGPQELLNHIHQVLEHLRTQSCVDFTVTARLAFYYTATARDLIKRHLQKTPDEADKIFAQLNRGLVGSRITEIDLEIANAPDLESALKIAREKIGHYSSRDMLEIHHPLFRHNEAAMINHVEGLRNPQFVENIMQQRDKRVKAQEFFVSILPTEHQEEFVQTIEASLTYMALRETAKYHFTREYALIKEALAMLEERLDLSNGDIYFLYPKELQSLISSPDSYRHLIESRKQAYANYPQLDFPKVIREEDINLLSLIDSSDTEFTTAQGKFLAEGPEICGTVVNLDEMDLESAVEIINELKLAGQMVIVCAKQMNLSHDPLIALADGLVLENAGIASHGAQRARELGKGALGGIKIKNLRTSMRVIFNPDDLSIRKAD